MKFYDTSALLNSDYNFSDVCISSVSLIELENIKTSSHKDEATKYKAREVVRAIKEQNPKVVMTSRDDYNVIDNLGLETNDDNLICACVSRTLNKNDVFYTDDYLMMLIAREYFHLNVQGICNDKSNTDNLYLGYKIVEPTDEELVAVYEKDNCDNIFDCLVNQYVIIKNSDKVCDVLRWTGEKYASVYNKPFKSRQLGKCSPLDEYQRMAFDSIVNNDVTVLFGRSGSGKTTIPLAYIMQMLESGKYRKCYIVHSYDTLKGQKTLGYVKGDTLTKQLETGSLGGIMASKLGDLSELERFIMSGQIEIIPTANLRGIEIPSDTCCYSTEAQNLDLYALKTLIQRCKTGSKLILDGDILEQIDTSRGSGLFRMIDVFKGNKSFGCVKLKNNYRSEIGELADKL